jgi:glycosyltransferase involved in cell wall biosynthesis
VTAPRVSILIPVYNRRTFVEPCVASALQQTIADLEVVVVDNASTDGTWAICERLAARDSRVRIFRNERNIGPVRNWRRCLDVARGCYGKVLFSDDLIEPTFLARTLPFLGDPGVGFVFTAARIGPTPEEGRVAYRFRSASECVPAGDFIEAALFGGNVPVSPGCAVFRMEDLRESLVLEIPSPSIRDFPAHGAGPDLLLYLLTARRYPSVVCIPEPLSFFRAHAGSITISTRGAYIERCYQQARIWFAQEYLDDAVQRRLWAIAWLKACVRHRGWVSPPRAIAPFVADASWAPSVGDTLIAIADVVFQKLVREFRGKSDRGSGLRISWVSRPSSSGRY